MGELIVWEVIVPTKVIQETKLGCGRSSTQQPTFTLGLVKSGTSPGIKHGIQSRTNNHPLTAFGHCPVGTYGTASHVLMKKLTENQNLRGYGPTAYVLLELAVELFCPLLGSGVARLQPFANSIAMWMSCVTGEKSMTSHHQCAMDFQNGLPNIFSLSVNLTFCFEATSFLSNPLHALVFSGHHRT